MEDVNLLLCGNLWQNLGDHEAGWELIRALRSSDPHVREAVQGYLVEAGPRSISLLQVAVASGALVGALATECMVTLIKGTSWDSSPDEPAFADPTYDC
jgi:hypothetical protein